jgi:ferric-dicitrate binding protein FerR (iron transport regulator)
MSDQAGRGGAAPDASHVTLDAAIASVRDDVPAPGVEEKAATRAWERLAAAGNLLSAQGRVVPMIESIAGCADVLALLEARRRGELPPPRALLVDDHLRECVTCRSAMLRPGQRRLALLPWRPEIRRAEAPSRRAYAVAASILLAIGVAAAATHQAFFAVPAGSRAAVQSLTGGLQRVGAGRAAALAPGEEVGEGEPVRTGRASRAVLRLRDGSLVEMGERAELAVTARGSDTTIRLARGNIIVRAAKRRSGHLRVASGECTVSVTGTVFSVNHGLKGSRVSVLEGEVKVAAAGAEQVVAPGEQWTSEAVERQPLEDEIAWSGEVDRHLALLGELKVLQERWRAVRTPGLRYETRLLPLLPESAVVFASLPNYGETLAEAHRLFEERLEESATLREWWARVDPQRHGGPSLAQVMEKVRSFSGFLGDEVVLAAVEDGRRRRDVPLLVAELRQAGLREFLEGELAGRQGGRRPSLRIVDGDDVDEAITDELVVLIRGSVMAVSTSAAALGDLARRVDDGSPGLDRTRFGARLTAAYGDGVGVLFAADLERIRDRVQGQDRQRDEAIRRSGVDGLRYFVLERKQAAEVAQSRAAVQAVLTFDGPPRGLPSWLAAPGPMGALEFVSARAEVAAAFVIKSPALILDDIVGIASVGDAGTRQAVADLEAKLDLRLREDIAETLGAEIAFALDGPLLPTPAWKVIVEVYDPARLQASLQTLVARASDEAQRDDRPPVRLEAEQAGGETYYAVRGDLPFEVHYAYSGGYLVAAPTRALVRKAIQARAGGDTLARSERLRALFTPDRDVNVSAVLYQNLAPLVGSLLEAPGAARLSAEQRRSVQALAGDAGPTLLCAYGEPDGIRVAGLGGGFDLDTGDLALPLLIQRVFPDVARVAVP